MTLSCRELVELVTEYTEGSLEPETRARFEQHVSLCDGCRRYVDQMRATIRATGALRDEDVAPEARQTLVAAFRGWKARR